MPASGTRSPATSRRASRAASAPWRASRSPAQPRPRPPEQRRAIRRRSAPGRFPQYPEVMMCTMRRTRFLVALVAVLAAAGLAACGGDGRDGASGSPDAVVARVHGRALDVAVDRELVRAEAERLGLAADESEVASRVAAVGAQLGGDAALKSALMAAFS